MGSPSERSSVGPLKRLICSCCVVLVDAGHHWNVSSSRVVPKEAEKEWLLTSQKLYLNSSYIYFISEIKLLLDLDKVD